MIWPRNVVLGCVESDLSFFFHLWSHLSGFCSILVQWLILTPHNLWHSCHLYFQVHVSPSFLRFPTRTSGYKIKAHLRKSVQAAHVESLMSEVTELLWHFAHTLNINVFRLGVAPRRKNFKFTNSMNSAFAQVFVGCVVAKPHSPQSAWPTIGISRPTTSSNEKSNQTKILY